MVKYLNIFRWKRFILMSNNIYNKIKAKVAQQDLRV